LSLYWGPRTLGMRTLMPPWSLPWKPCTAWIPWTLSVRPKGLAKILFCGLSSCRRWEAAMARLGFTSGCLSEYGQSVFLTYLCNILAFFIFKLIPIGQYIGLTLHEPASPVCFNYESLVFRWFSTRHSESQNWKWWRNDTPSQLWWI
jgi:hypothetical protein